MDASMTQKAEEFKKHVGTVIKRNRERCGFIQYSLASDLGIKAATISRYEQGKSEIKASTMAMISQICDFDMIEYIPMDESSVSQRFNRLVHMSGISPYRPLKESSRNTQVPYTDTQFMGYMTNKSFSYTSKTEKVDEIRTDTIASDLLYDFPDTQPVPLNKDDQHKFEIHIEKPSNRDRLKVLMYGYGLMTMFHELDTPYRTTSSMVKQILRRIIREPNGDVDSTVFDYYIKCLFDNKRL